MRIPVFGTVIDERYVRHRYRATSMGSVAGGLAAVGLFWYRYTMDGIWSWDLLAVAITIAAVKWAFMTWYHFTD